MYGIDDMVDEIEAGTKPAASKVCVSDSVYKELHFVNLSSQAISFRDSKLIILVIIANPNLKQF